MQNHRKLVWKVCVLQVEYPFSLLLTSMEVGGVCIRSVDLPIAKLGHKE
jgi:hypothetical protein